MQSREITLSVVSHEQAELVQQLLDDIDRTGAVYFLKEVIIINNIPDESSYRLKSIPLTVITNSKPKGFGANHNEAFKLAKSKYFCVVNPDIRLNENPFPELLKGIDEHRVAVAAPLVYTADDKQEDSIRYFPTLSGLFKKLMMLSDGRYPLESGYQTFNTEWAAGMFLLFKSNDFDMLGGFDEKFFLYYEDTDICARMWSSGRHVVVCSKARVIHEARRSSHKSLRYLSWHINSLLRYFWKHWFRLPDIKALESDEK